MADDPALVFAQALKNVMVSAPTSPAQKLSQQQDDLEVPALNTNSSSGDNDQRSHGKNLAPDSNEELNQTVSEILSLLSQEKDDCAKQPKEQKLYQRAKLLKAPKASEVPIF